MLAAAEPLLPTGPARGSPSARVLAWTTVLALASAPLVWCLLLMWSRDDPGTVLAATSTQHGGSLPYLHGVSLGGWLLLEINPSARDEGSSPDVRPQWMFDQIEAKSELDFVTRLRADKGDEYALQTMANHWSGYISDEALDKARALGVDAVRIPVGYWIVEPPLGGTTPYELGFQAEGFVTGGLRWLEEMLPKLRARQMVALIDLHALPCNSACVSDGLDCKAPLAFAPEHEIGPIERCEGDGVFATTRRPSVATGGARTWGDVGVASAAKLAAWVASLPDEDAAVVAALQLGNEPALNSYGYNEAVRDYYRRALAAARASLPPSLPLVMSFIPPNDYAVPAFVRALAAGGGGTIWIDHHWYLNWASAPGVTLPWSDLHRRACHEAANSWSSYTDAHVRIVLGEWSLATNHDAPLDLDDPHTRAELRRLFHEQRHVYATSPTVVGAFYWTLRMGSGWDPRPDAPARQAAGSSASRSLPSYPFKVWSLLEMAAHGVIDSVKPDAAEASAHATKICAEEDV